MFAQLAQYTKETDPDNPRQKAEIRLYCDNDARLDVVGNDPKQDVGTLNNDRTGSDLLNQQWIDTINQIEVGGVPGCKLNDIRTDRKTTAAVTYFSPRDATDPDGVPQAKNRASITVSLPATHATTMFVSLTV